MGTKDNRLILGNNLPRPTPNCVFADLNLAVWNSIAIHTCTRYKFWRILIWRFRLKTTKPQNLILRQIFWLYIRYIFNYLRLTPVDTKIPEKLRSHPNCRKTLELDIVYFSEKSFPLITVYFANIRDLCS